MDVIIGELFTFQILYVSSAGVPFVPLTPTITIFYYNTAGTRIDLVSSQPLVAAVPAEVGRYVYPYTFSGSIPTGTAAYASFTAIDPGSGQSLRSEQELNLMTRSSCDAMGIRFVR